MSVKNRHHTYWGHKIVLSTHSSITTRTIRMKPCPRGKQHEQVWWISTLWTDGKVLINKSLNDVTKGPSVSNHRRLNLFRQLDPVSIKMLMKTSHYWFFHQPSVDSPHNGNGAVIRWVFPCLGVTVTSSSISCLSRGLFFGWHLYVLDGCPIT